MPYEIKIKNFNYNKRHVEIVHNHKKICGIECCLFIIVILSWKFNIVLFFKTDFSPIR